MPSRCCITANEYLHLKFSSDSKKDIFCFLVRTLSTCLKLSKGKQLHAKKYSLDEIGFNTFKYGCYIIFVHCFVQVVYWNFFFIAKSRVKVGKPFSAVFSEWDWSNDIFYQRWNFCLAVLCPARQKIYLGPHIQQQNASFSMSFWKVLVTMKSQCLFVLLIVAPNFLILDFLSYKGCRTLVYFSFILLI